MNKSVEKPGCREDDFSTSCEKHTKKGYLPPPQKIKK